MKSRIMNEDVVEEILTYIEFRQLFQMQRISKQFCFCVERLLRRKVFLSFGEMKESILCEDFKHNSNYPLIGKTSSIVWNYKYIKLNIRPIVSKCPNIRCLYLNKSLGLETIEPMVQICERLECLCLCSDVFLNSKSITLKTIKNLLSKRVVHLSIECRMRFTDNDDIDGKVIEFIRDFASLQNLKIIHLNPLNNTLDFVAKNLKSLNISCPLYWVSNEEDIISLMSYIEQNNKCLEILFISDYLISEELFASICSHLDLKKLSISCKLLSLSSLIRNLSKSQPNLSFLTLFGLRFENSVLVSDRNYLKIRSLGLNLCQFEVKSFIQFLKLFRFLEKLDLNGLYFRCECNPIVDDFCPECNQKCLTELSKPKTLKVLAMNVQLTNLSSIWQSLTRIPNLEKLIVFGVIQLDFKQLAQNLVEVLSEKTTKYFRLELPDSTAESVFGEELKHLCLEMPRNLIIIC